MEICKQSIQFVDSYSIIRHPGSYYFVVLPSLSMRFLLRAKWLLIPSHHIWLQSSEKKKRWSVLLPFSLQRASEFVHTFCASSYLPELTSHRHTSLQKRVDIVAFISGNRVSNLKSRILILGRWVGTDNGG